MEKKVKYFMENKCIFVIDTNVYLNLYDFSPDIAEFFIDIISKPTIKDNIYVPSTIKREFDKNHIRCWGKQKKKFKNIPKELKKHTESAQIKINKQLNILERFKFPGIDNLKSNLKNKMEEIDGMFTHYVEECNIFQRINEKFSEEDKIFGLVQSICAEGRLLNSLSVDQIYSICEEGKTRYSQCIPPGFMDGNAKDGVEKYNDLILWKETIQFFKNENRNLIFVVDDVKKDWWKNNSEGHNVFHEYLINEFEESTGLKIIGITSFDLYDALANILRITIPDTVERVLKFSAEDYIQGLVESDDLKYSLSDELICSGESYVCTDSLSHYDGSYFEIEEILAIKFINFEFEGYRSKKAIYGITLHVKASAHSKDYVAREDETKNIYLGSGYIHTLEGEVSIKIKRTAETYLDNLLDDISFDELEVISGELTEVQVEYVDDSDEFEEEEFMDAFCVVCGKKSGEVVFADECVCLDCSISNKNEDVKWCIKSSKTSDF